MAISADFRNRTSAETLISALSLFFLQGDGAVHFDEPDAAIELALLLALPEEQKQRVPVLSEMPTIGDLYEGATLFCSHLLRKKQLKRAHF